MTMTPAQRRAYATIEIRSRCAQIIAQVEAGPIAREPTTKDTALRFEAIAEALLEPMYRTSDMLTGHSVAGSNEQASIRRTALEEHYQRGLAKRERDYNRMVARTVAARKP